MTLTQDADMAALAWRVRFKAPPGRVFNALVGAASRHGRVSAIENFGQTLVFTPPRLSRYACPPLRATVEAHASGSVVTFAPARPPQGATDIAAEAESVASLIHQLREHFGAGRS